MVLGLLEGHLEPQLFLGRTRHGTADGSALSACSGDVLIDELAVLSARLTSPYVVITLGGGMYPVGGPMNTYRLYAIAGFIALGATEAAIASVVAFDAVAGAEIRVNLDPDDPEFRRNFPTVEPDFSGLVFERSFQTETPFQALSTGPVSVDTQVSTDADISSLTASVRASLSGNARDGATISVPAFDARAGFIVENTSSEFRIFLADVDRLFDYSVSRTSLFDTAAIEIAPSLLDNVTGELGRELTAGGTFLLRPGREDLTFDQAVDDTLGFAYVMEPGDRFFVGLGVGGVADIRTTETAPVPVPLPAASYLLAMGLAMLGLFRRRRA